MERVVPDPPCPGDASSPAVVAGLAAVVEEREGVDAAPWPATQTACFEQTYTNV